MSHDETTLHSSIVYFNFDYGGIDGRMTDHFPFVLGMLPSVTVEKKSQIAPRFGGE